MQLCFALLSLALLVVLVVSMGCCAPGKGKKTPSGLPQVNADPDARLPLTPEGRRAEAQSCCELDWSGLRWAVKDSGDKTVGPGPNHFSGRNLRVDEQGWLHLRITERNGVACGAEIVAKTPTHYGRYVWRLESMTGLRAHEVLGFFVYGDPKDEGIVPVVPEIDIELARWGQDTEKLLQLTVQPWHKQQNLIRVACPTDARLTFWFDWRPDRVDFGVKHTQTGKIVATWSYSGPDLPVTPLTTRLNLWGFEGATSDPPECEAVISSFRFTPLKGS